MVIAGWLLLLSLIPLLIFFVYSISLIQKNAQKDTISRLDAARNVAMQNLEQYQKISSDYAKLIANIKQVKEAILKKDHLKLIQIIAPLQSEMNVDIIAITDDKGILLARSDKLSMYGDNWANEYLVKCGLARFKYTTIEQREEMIYVKSVSDIVTQMSANNMKVLGTVIVGYKIDKRMAKNIYTLTNMFPLIFINREKEAITIDEAKTYQRSILKEHIDKVFRGEAEDITATDIGSKKSSYILIPIKKQGATPVGVLAIVANNNVANSFIASSMRFSLILVFLTLILVFSLSLLIANRITKPISILAKSSKSISSGNFDIELPRKRDDEIGVLANEFWNMAKSIKNFVVNIEETVKATHHYTQKLNEIVEESGKTNKIAAGQIKDIISMAEKQSENFKNIEKNILEINQQIEYGSMVFKAMDDYASDVLSSVYKEEKSIQDLINNMFKVNETINDVAKDLQSAIKEFNNVVNTSMFISKLSEQIKLISLNASIEAAKRNIPSFGIIANEINRLSQSTDNFAKKISTIVDETIKMFNKTRNNLNKCLNIVQNGVEIANESNRALKNIKEVNHSMKDKIEQIVTSIQEQQKRILDINRALKLQTDNTLKYFNTLSSIKGVFHDQFVIVEKITEQFKSVHDQISKLSTISFGEKGE